MRLSESQERLLQSVAESLERQQFSQFLTEDDVPSMKVQELLQNNIPDLAIIGLYVVSLREQEPDFSQYNEHPASARNAARYAVAESLSRYGTVSVEHFAARTDAFVNSFGELGARLAQPTGISTVVGSVPEMTILVHGTWAATSTWWQPSGSLWTHVNGITGNAYSGSDSFSWSGRNKHADRVKAAQDLCAWANTHPTDHLDIIAHSHGGNVCLLASRLGLKIRKLINLGTPIRLEYLPNLSNIGVLHNVFSTGDRVQTPTATIPNRRAEGRSLGDSSTTMNHRAADDGRGNNPGHSELHEPVTWQASNLDSLL